MPAIVENMLRTEAFFDCELAGVLHNVRGMVVFSGYGCELYRELYGDWTRYDRSTFTDSARARVEKTATVERREDDATNDHI